MEMEVEMEIVLLGLRKTDWEREKVQVHRMQLEVGTRVPLI